MVDRADVAAAVQQSLILLTAELDAALGSLGQPPVAEHPAFAIERDHHDPFQVITVRVDGIETLRVSDFDAYRFAEVSFGGLPECLTLRLPGAGVRGGRKWPRARHVLARLLVSTITVVPRRRSTVAYLTAPDETIWARNVRVGLRYVVPRRARTFPAVCSVPADG